jgi:hypothetical protein
MALTGDGFANIAWRLPMNVPLNRPMLGTGTTRRVVLFWGLLLQALPSPASAHDAAEARIARCIVHAAGGRPWLEKTLWGLRDQESGWIGAEVRNTNGSYDLGPLQINTWWVPRIAALVGRPEAQVRHWLRFDPCFNVDAARWIFLTALTDTGDFWRAVGIYHSPTAWRQQRYALSVAKRMKQRFGRELFYEAAGARPMVGLHPLDGR